MPRWRGVGEIRPAAGRRRPVAPRCGVRALALTLAWGAALAPAGAVTCTVPSASYASLARAVNDEQLSDRILKACRKAALKLGDDTLKQ